MIFNSLQFAVFLGIVYPLYLKLKHPRQNQMLVVASCVFYAAWDWRFLFLMLGSISIDYLCALQIDRSSSNAARKTFLAVSIVLNLSILGFFKYFNFFETSLQALLNWTGIPVRLGTMRILLPIGISFYTFEAMTYVIDVYRKKMQPTRRYLDYALFVLYFPHLVAGPIMRAKDLLPQIQNPRVILPEGFRRGCFLIFWGFFQKIFVADNLAGIVNALFAQAPHYNGAEVLIGAYAFALQIYCDFAGYSNIARGIGKCMGFDITVNFNLPYFSACPKEFWQRWHISLSTWIRDYLYIPLGGNRGGWLGGAATILITFALAGLWHGAAWTFVLWGLYHAALIIAYRSCEPLRMPFARAFGFVPPGLRRLLATILFFHLVCVGWIFFRAESLSQCGLLLSALARGINPAQSTSFWNSLVDLIFFACLLMAADTFEYFSKHPLPVLRLRPYTRTAFYCLCLGLLLLYGNTSEKPFIYFQF